jgi:hypothetical protein
MTSDLQSKCLMENGYVFEGPGRVCTIVIHSQNAGVLTMKDGGSGGTTKIEVGYGSNANFTIPIGGHGVRFSTSIYLSATNLDRITVFWG